MVLHPPAPAFADIIRPTLLVNEVRAHRNIMRMAERAHSAGLKFRPHFKTHQSAAIGDWFRAYGVDAITVSSVDMARYFARHGWQDITVAFPVNLRELPKIDILAAAVQLGLLVDTPATVSALAAKLTHRVRVWIEVDTGYGRTGISWDHTAEVVALAGAIAACDRLTFAGLLSHTGQTYQATALDDVLRLHDQALVRLCHLQEAMISADLGPCALSLGDTPACSVADNWRGIDEVRPGNFVFNDLMQHRAGVCRDVDLAVAVACPVVGKYPSRGQVVVYGGAVHLSKEFLRDATGRRLYGYVARWNGKSWSGPEPRAALVSLSQEHGILEVADSLLPEIEVGQLLLILPVHSCLTADLYGEYRTLDGGALSRMQSNADPETRG